MLKSYPAIIEKDEGSDFGIFFPDFPGCVSAGATPEDAIVMGTEALTGHVAAMIKDGDALPVPTPIAALPRDPDVNQVAVALIQVSLPGRSVRLNITLDEGLLSEIDAVAGDRNRSGFLASAARAELVRRRATV